MYITDQTAQLILDALAWELMDNLDEKVCTPYIVEQARKDFVRFCDDRGIEGVEVVKGA